MAESLHKAAEHLWGNVRKDFCGESACIPDTPTMRLIDADAVYNKAMEDHQKGEIED